MVLAIEADGASYRDSRSARDRDRLRKEHLERLGWTFHRIWSTNWFTDPATEAARVEEAYREAVEAAEPEDGPTDPLPDAAGAPGPDVASPDGPVPSSPVPGSPVPNGPVPSSLVPDDPVPGSLVPDGPVPSSPVANSPATGSLVPDGPVRDGLIRDGLVHDGPAHDGPADDAPPPPGPSQAIAVREQASPQRRLPAG